MTQISLSSSHAARVSAVACSLVLLAPRARAQPAAPSVTPAAPAPANAAAPPTEAADGEMHFHSAPSSATPTGQTGPNANAQAADRARARSMDEFAEGSEHTLKIEGIKARYAMNFFGDVNFLESSEPGSHPSFALGAQNFLVTGKLDDHFTATAEFAIEFGEDNTPGVDLERLHVGYKTDHFFVRAGRVHTEFGYWSNAYHHGKWLSPSIERPRWVAFEDDKGLLPIHTVGVGGGAIAQLADTTKLVMTAYVANSRGRVVDDVRNKFDYHDGKSVGGEIELVGLGLTDLRIGISGMHDVIPGADATIRPALPDQSIREYILGAHVAYPAQPLVLILESYLVEHRIPGHSWTTLGGFALAGYAFGPMMPYVRGELVTQRGGDDPFYLPDPSKGETVDQLEGIAGLRYDLTSWTALRAEYRATQLGREGAPHHAGVLQWAWAF